MSAKRLFFPIPGILLLLLLLFTFHSDGRSTHLSSSCPPSSCGHLEIRYPFRLTTDPTFCGYSTEFQLDCQSNETILNLTSTTWYFVKHIYYEKKTIWVVDPRMNTTDLSSCPNSTLPSDDWLYYYVIFDSIYRTQLAFIHCLSPLSSMNYIKAPFCGHNSSMAGNFSESHSYVMVGHSVLDLEESCTVDRVVGWVSRKKRYTSLSDILGYGFELSYEQIIFEDYCERNFDIRFWRYTYKNGIHYFHYELCCLSTPEHMTRKPFKCVDYSLRVTLAIYAASIIVGLIILRFMIGFPLMIWLVMHKWRRRHLCMDKTIEEFLQGQQNLAPITYTYSEIKKMTNNFMQKLGEGGCGTVYKGKLRSGSSVAIKMMEQSTASEDEFISEVSTIGRIHHTNIVQLIGFCVERSKCALVYEFLSNGSLDRYIFNQESLDVVALTYEKLFEIALGVARGIDYLHHGCNMQILHFDIKPHNILLDKNFNPKISDFGLARLRFADESFVNLTDARGTMGYMAPEMFYRNYRGITYKADVYSFGMMLMEMASKRKNTIPHIEDASQMHFPYWAYDQLRAGKDIEMGEYASEEENRIVKRIIIVALWCIQMRPSSRPPMNKVIEMLESEAEPQMPPKPFVAPNEMAADHGISRTYSVDYVTMN